MEPILSPGLSQRRKAEPWLRRNRFPSCISAHPYDMITIWNRAGGAKRTASAKRTVSAKRTGTSLTGTGEGLPSEI